MNLVRDWARRRTIHHSEWPAERVAAQRTASVTVCLPARNEARTIGPILEVLLPLRERGVVDQVLVVDDSADGTGDIARGLGAEVHDQSELHPELGPVQGKGDAMWRSLSVVCGDVVCFVDADSEDFGEHFACGLIGPVACTGDIDLVKGFYRRPLRLGKVRLPEGGGRVTELTARPLLNAFYPELAGFVQPLAGEVAARRDLFERLPFVTGYGVDVGLLIDSWREVGLWRLAQIDLDVRQNQHQTLAELGPMAAAVLRAIADRMVRDGRLTETPAEDFLMPIPGGFDARPVEPVERPPVRAATPA